MPESCTCGASLPPDARFCHKCGKPQREENITLTDAAETPAAAPPRSLEPPAAPVPLSFRNPIAVKAGLLAAGLISFVMMIPGVNYAWILWLLGGGYFSVWTYKRRTGQRLTVRGGARIGWMTGVLSFTLITVLFTFCMLMVQRAGGLGVLKERLSDFAFQQSAVDEVIKLLQNPYEILRSLIVMFVVMTLTCTAGGALGAKILGKH